MTRKTLFAPLSSFRKKTTRLDALAAYAYDDGFVPIHRDDAVNACIR
jgi:hypothetical protein